MQARPPFIPRLVFRPSEVMDYAKFGLRNDVEAGVAPANAVWIPHSRAAASRIPHL